MKNNLTVVSYTLATVAGVLFVSGAIILTGKSGWLHVNGKA